MDVTDRVEKSHVSGAVATCDDVAGLEEALAALGSGGAEAVVLMDAGSHDPADAARFAAALIAGARDARSRERSRRKAAWCLCMSS